MHLRVLPVAVYAQIGGIFALLVLTHFVADWVFQSHAEAMAKSTNHKVRAKHCAVYTVLCLIPVVIMGRPGWEALAWMTGILFFSHFFEDTYLPVFLWAKYIRKPPEMFPPPNKTVNQGGLVLKGLDYKIELPPPTKKEFLAFVTTPLGTILLIAIDQIVHLVFLVPVAAMIVVPSNTTKIGIFGATLTLCLMNVTLIGSNKLKGSKA